MNAVPRDGNNMRFTIRAAAPASQEDDRSAADYSDLADEPELECTYIFMIMNACRITKARCDLIKKIMKVIRLNRGTMCSMKQNDKKLKFIFYLCS